MPPNRHHFLLWCEWTANAGPNEVLSALVHILKTLGTTVTGNGVLKIIADNCPINKCQYLCGLANEMCDPSSEHSWFRRVDIIWPTVGHTFIEPDSGFATIESKFNKMNPEIWQPADWIPFIRNCFRGGSNHPHVEMLQQKTFKEWKKPLASKYSIIGKNLLEMVNTTLRFVDISYMTFGEFEGCLHLGEMWFKYSLSSPENWKKINMMKQGVKRNTTLPTLEDAYNGPLELDAIKMQTLHEYTPFIPEYVRYLYPPADPENLRVAKQKQQNKRDARGNIAAPQNTIDDAVQDLISEMDRLGCDS